MTRSLSLALSRFLVLTRTLTFRFGDVHAGAAHDFLEGAQLLAGARGLVATWVRRRVVVAEVRAVAGVVPVAAAVWRGVVVHPFGLALSLRVQGWRGLGYRKTREGCSMDEIHCRLAY